MNFFENKVLEFSDTECGILGRIIAEARNCFVSPLDNPYLEKMEKKDDIPFGAQKLLTLYLKNWADRCYPTLHNGALFCLCRYLCILCQSTSETCRNIIHYLEQHIRESMTINEISKSNMIGRSQLQKLFRDQYQCGVIEFFSRMKIDFAKQLIRENDMNFTQISDFLGIVNSLFFKAVRKTVRNDSYGICHIHQSYI